MPENLMPRAKAGIQNNTRGEHLIAYTQQRLFDRLHF
jgi:hypothetical protein